MNEIKTTIRHGHKLRNRHNLRQSQNKKQAQLKTQSQYQMKFMKCSDNTQSM